MMYKKIKTAAAFALAAVVMSGTVSAAGRVTYERWDGEIDYGSDQVYAAADKSTGAVVPLSREPFDGYTYAYMPNGGEIETVMLMPYEFADLPNDEFGVGCDIGLPEDVYYWNTPVDAMSVRGVITGYEDGTFMPGRELTRAEMAAVFARLFSVEKSGGETCFSDVPIGHWCAGYIKTLTDKGVFSTAETFAPDAKVTREQLTAMTYRMLEHMGLEGESGEYDLSIYKDAENVSEYARVPYARLLNNGYSVLQRVIYNDDFDSADDEFYLDPQRTVTRFECAEYLYNFIRAFFDANAPAILRDDAPAEEIPVLDGSTSTYDITQQIYMRYYVNHKNHPDFPKVHSKTSNSYKRLTDGEVDMIFVPDPSEDIRQYAEEKGVTLRYIPIANEALVFFTSEDNEVGSITTEQLRSIYVDDAVDNWSELGGADAEFVPFCRNNDSGSHAQMEQFILDGAEIHPDIRREHTSWMMSSILTEVDAFNRENEGKYAIGYSLYYYFINASMFTSTEGLKLLDINGVSPTDETLAEGTYPYTTHYYAVIRDDADERTEKFAELMQGEFGKEIMKLSGMGAL